MYGAGERFLHLSIECAVDSGNHIISDMRYKKPGSYRDIFVVLGEKHVISTELGRNLRIWPTFVIYWYMTI
ncbi:MAG TPA: DUF86 domain-containing protein [Clostridia bacterium]|nr:DUF86 domain-containing protein [Clostridia bacterium]